jgi:hypothetical protein
LREEISRRFARHAIWLLFLAGLLWSLRSLVRYWSEHLSPDAEVNVSLGVALLGLRLLLLMLAGYLGIRLFSTGLPERSHLSALRTLLYCPLFGLFVASAAGHRFVPTSPHWPIQSIFFASMMAAQIFWALGWSRERGPGNPPVSRTLVTLDLMLGNFLLLLAIAELSLTIWGAIRPSPLVFHESVGSSLAAHRRPSHQSHHGSRLNQGGFADDEFLPGTANRRVIAVIGDSFGLGVVPISQNYVSVAEQTLNETLEGDSRHILLHNFGVPAIGLAEYAELFRTEVERWNPSVVVVSVFVGNDIHQGLSFTRPRTRRYRLQQWLSWNAIARAMALLQDGRLKIEQVASLGLPPTTPDSANESRPVARPERPTFSEERFFEIEKRRIEVTRADEPEISADYEQFFAGLRYFERALGDSLIVAIIPDEFQVNDALWRSIAGDDKRFERDLPQRRILEFCARHSIECIDFLPELRDAEMLGRTYHQRDTHWNERGNRVAGLELARRLAQKIGLADTR